MSSFWVRWSALLLTCACLIAPSAAPAATVKVRQSTTVSGASITVVVKIPARGTKKARVALQVRKGGKWAAATVGTARRGRARLRWTAPSANAVRFRVVVRLKGKVIAVSGSWVAHPRPPSAVAAPPAKPAPPTTATTTPAPVLRPVGPGPARVLAAGGRHACVIASDRTVRCWGDNDHGAIGDGTTTTRLTPVSVVGLTGVARIAAGTDHTCALRTDGSVWCWGSGSSGQLGDGSTAPSRQAATPIRIDGLGGIVDLNAGGRTTCALRNGGNWWCWGGETAARPADQGANVGIVAMDSGGSCISGPADALVRCPGNAGPFPADTSDAVARSWGNCALRPGGVITCHLWAPTGLLPELSLSAPGATSIAIADLSVCAARPDGPVLCWDIGPLLAGGALKAPVEVPGATGVVTLSASEDAMCGVLTSREIRCWGSPADGALGDGRDGRIGLPVPVSVAPGATDVALDDAQGCAIVAGGATCWGLTSRGTVETFFAGGPLVPSSSDFISVSPISRGACATTAAGQVSCWGTLPADSLRPGGGSVWTNGLPQRIAGLDGVQQVTGAAGGAPTCALTTSTVNCWGDEGVATTRWESGSRPAVDDMAGASTIAVGGGLCAVVAGGVRCIAPDADGLGGRTPTHAPGAVGPATTLAGTAGATDVDIDERHGCAVIGSQARCWGANDAGQLGRTLTGSADTSATATVGAVGSIGAARAVAVGDAHSCALLLDGTVSCWGANDLAQLGDPSWTGGVQAHTVPGISDATAITAGGNATCVIRASHALTCWGEGKLLPVSTRATGWTGVTPAGLGVTAG